MNVTYVNLISSGMVHAHRAMREKEDEEADESSNRLLRTTGTGEVQFSVPSSLLLFIRLRVRADSSDSNAFVICPIFRT